MTEPVEFLTEPPAASTSSCGCGCGHEDVPVLDVRPVPHAIRHATVFGAFSAIAPGKSMVIIAPHAPLPLLDQLAHREPVDIEFLVEGPDEWHVLLTRQG